MAAYYWIGGTTLDNGISGAAHDWNVPSNWRILSLGNSIGIGEPTPVIPDTCPGAGDVVYIGRNTPDGKTDALSYPNVGIIPKAPLLWGGYKTISGESGTGTWICGGTTGATLANSGNGLTGALNSIIITIGKNDLPGGVTGTSYCHYLLGMKLDAGSPDNPLGSEQLAYTLNMGLGLKQYSQSQWKTLIDQNKLSYSGLTGLFIKANNVKINSLPIPTNSSVYAHSEVNINWVDNVNIAPTSVTSPKYNTSASISINGGVVVLKDTKFKNLFLTTNLKYYKTSEAGVRLTGSGCYLSVYARDLWYNLYIGENNKISDADLVLLGAEYYNPSEENYLGDNYVKSIGYSGSNHAYRTSKVISGTYNKSSVYPIFGITAAGSTGYVDTVKSLKMQLAGTEPSVDFDYHIPPSPFIGMRGAVTVMGITADGLALVGYQAPPAHFYTWNTRTEQYECKNQEVFSEPCSYGQMEDYISPVLFTGFNNTINNMEVTYARVIPVLPFENNSNLSRIQTFNIGKVVLTSSILETSMFGPNTIWWSDTDPNDFVYQQEPDWKFGSITNSSTGVTLDGGIVFGDEYAQVRGAASVRLLNYVVNKVTNKNNRTNTLLNEITGNKIPPTTGSSYGGSQQAL